MPEVNQQQNEEQVIDPAKDGAPVDGVELPTRGDESTTPEANNSPQPNEPPVETAEQKAAKEEAQRRSERFSRITREREDAERRAREADERLTKALDALAKATGEKKPVETSTTVEDQPPAPPTFESPEQYQKAMAEYTEKMVAYSTKRELRAAEAERQRQAADTARQAQERAQQEASVRLQAQFRQRVDTFKAEAPDYDEVTSDPEVPISIVMTSGIALSDKGPALAYWLGKNRAEAQRIANLPPALQLMELGVIAATKLAAPPPKPRNAPPPPRHLNGGKGGNAKPIAEMSMDEYAAHRKAGGSAVH